MRMVWHKEERNFWCVMTLIFSSHWTADGKIGTDFLHLRLALARAMNSACVKEFSCGDMALLICHKCRAFFSEAVDAASLSSFRPDYSEERGAHHNHKHFHWTMWVKMLKTSFPAMLSSNLADRNFDFKTKLCSGGRKEHRTTNNGKMYKCRIFLLHTIFVPIFLLILLHKIFDSVIKLNTFRPFGFSLWQRKDRKYRIAKEKKIVKKRIHWGFFFF